MIEDESTAGNVMSGAPASGRVATRTSAAGDMPTVHAAGAVVWRARLDGKPEVAVVHRPRYNDWSLPKGKLDPGETIAHAASREVTEETGLTCTLSRYLRQVTYPIPPRDGEGEGQALKLVDYFAAHAHHGSFVPNEEVDTLRWMTTEQARQQLSYVHDGDVLDDFDALPTDVATVLLVRHAKAGKRSQFDGDDTLRPLSKAGFAQRRALHTLLPLFGPDSVYSAPRLRCEQTVSPVASDLGVDIGAEPLLSEEGYWPDPEVAVQRLLRIASMSDTTLVCSQGDVIPDLVRRLATKSELNPDEIRSRKASLWILTFRRGPHSDGNATSALHLAAADYLAEPGF